MLSAAHARILYNQFTILSCFTALLICIQILPRRDSSGYRFRAEFHQENLCQIGLPAHRCRISTMSSEAKRHPLAVFQ